MPRQAPVPWDKGDRLEVWLASVTGSHRHDECGTRGGRSSEQTRQRRATPPSVRAARGGVPAPCHVESGMTDKYEKRDRYKTKTDKYEYKAEQAGSQLKPWALRRRKSKRGFDLAERFQAENIDSHRITLRNGRALGTFSKGKASIPLKEHKLPDLTLTRMTRASNGTSAVSMDYTQYVAERATLETLNAEVDIRPDDPGPCLNAPTISARHQPPEARHHERPAATQNVRTRDKNPAEILEQQSREGYAPADVEFLPGRREQGAVEFSSSTSPSRPPRSGGIQQEANHEDPSVRSSLSRAQTKYASDMDGVNGSDEGESNKWFEMFADRLLRRRCRSGDVHTFPPRSEVGIERYENLQRPSILCAHRSNTASRSSAAPLPFTDVCGERDVVQAPLRKPEPVASQAHLGAAPCNSDDSARFVPSFLDQFGSPEPGLNNTVPGANLSQLARGSRAACHIDGSVTHAVADQPDMVPDSWRLPYFANKPSPRKFESRPPTMSSVSSAALQIPGELPVDADTMSDLAPALDKAHVSPYPQTNPSLAQDLPSHESLAESNNGLDAFDLCVLKSAQVTATSVSMRPSPTGSATDPTHAYWGALDHAYSHAGRARKRSFESTAELWMSVAEKMRRDNIIPDLHGPPRHSKKTYKAFNPFTKHYLGM